MSVNRQYRTYRFLYSICRFIAGICCRLQTVGRENIPEGGALLCANHSHWCDPFQMAFALTKKVHLHLVAKKELFHNKLLNYIIRKIGSFPVDRSSADITAVRTVVRYLKGGSKVGIFPEGTRTMEDGAVEAKVGAVRMAEMAGVPVVPVYIPRKKRLFGRITVVIGKPFHVNTEHRHLKQEDYQRLTDQMMEQITLLGGTV